MIYDIGVIGCGPSGLFIPFEAGMKHLKCIMFDSLKFIGGQCTALYPEKFIYDIPSVPRITGSDLIENLHTQSQRFTPHIHLEEAITGYVKENGIFILQTSKNRNFKVKSIVIASGGGQFTPNRPPLEGIEDFEGKSVFYSVTSKENFRDKDIVIAGGGDSAVDWALALAPIAQSLKFIHRRDKFKAAPESISQLGGFVRQGKVELIVPFQLHSLSGEGGILKTVTVIDLKDEKRDLKADILLPFFGLKSDNTLAGKFGLETEYGVICVEPSTMRTNIEGIYAVGDSCCYKNKLKLILTGFAEVATCVRDIKQYLHPNEATHHSHSSDFFKQ